MQNERNQNLRFGLLMGAAMVSATMVTLAVWRASADDVPQPILTISQTDSNVFQIWVTNAVSSVNYELYRRPRFHTDNPWGAPRIGGQGQSNFNVTNIIMQQEFFRAAVGSDWDGDGIPNSQDGQPTNSAIGTLTITIDSPANGTTIQ